MLLLATEKKRAGKNRKAIQQALASLREENADSGNAVELQSLIEQVDGVPRGPSHRCDSPCLPQPWRSSSRGLRWTTSLYATPCRSTQKEGGQATSQAGPMASGWSQQRAIREEARGLTPGDRSVLEEMRGPQQLPNSRGALANPALQMSSERATAGLATPRRHDAHLSQMWKARQYLCGSGS
jgi:hypothetical protein